MKKENKVVIKKDCHSRSSSRSVSVRDIAGIYNACCYHNKEKTLLNKCVEDPRLRHSGMTPLLTAARGFTLIELLVVVLIIGILAAVAVPQYQKAVYKSRYATLKNFSESIAKAETVYYLANGAYTEDLEKLDVELSGGALDDSTPKKYVWDWGYCISFLATDMTDKINVHCINEDINMGYVKTLTPAQTTTNCYVYGSGDPADFPLQNDICKSETGLSKRTSGASHTLVGDYVRYQY